MSIYTPTETSTSATTPFFSSEDSGRDASMGQQHDRIQLEKQDTSAMAASNNSATDITVTQRMISATFGSVLTSLLVTPLDVVRVRLQSQSPTPSPLNLSRFPAYSTSFKQVPPDLGVTACCREVFWVGDNAEFCIAGSNATTTTAECAAEETQRKTFHSTLDGLKKIARNEGTLSLWRGLSPTLLMAIPANVIYFSGYDWLRFNHASPIHRFSNDTYAPLIAGAVARVAAAIAVSPVEMFRTRMQATAGSASGIFKSTLTGLHQMTQTQGYSSLWRGLTLTMWRDVPFSGLYWYGYETVRKQLSDSREKKAGRELNQDRSTMGYRQTQAAETHSATFVDSFLAGSISGGFAALVTTPFDVGKTRMQTYHHHGDELASTATATADTAKSSWTKSTATEAAKLAPEELPMPRFIYHIFKEEGMAGLFKGWAARCLKIAPACAIMISSYEVGKRWAKAINERKDDDALAS